MQPHQAGGLQCWTLCLLILPFFHLLLDRVEKAAFSFPGHCAILAFFSLLSRFHSIWPSRVSSSLARPSSMHTQPFPLSTSLSYTNDPIIFLAHI